MFSIDLAGRPVNTPYASFLRPLGRVAASEAGTVRPPDSQRTRGGGCRRLGKPAEAPAGGNPRLLAFPRLGQARRGADWPAGGRDGQNGRILSCRGLGQARRPGGWPAEGLGWPAWRHSGLPGARQARTGAGWPAEAWVRQKAAGVNPAARCGKISRSRLSLANLAIGPSPGLLLHDGLKPGTWPRSNPAGPYGRRRGRSRIDARRSTIDTRHSKLDAGQSKIDPGHSIIGAGDRRMTPVNFRSEEVSRRAAPVDPRLSGVDR